MNELEFDDLAEYDALQDLTGRERLIKLNKIRNYARFCIIQLKYVCPSSWTAFTPEEKMFIEVYNQKLKALEIATRKIMDEIIPVKAGLLRHFYENGEKVGSTLKRKVKNEKTIINITAESIESWTD